MPTVTMRFKLPEEDGDYKIAMKAGEMYCVILDIRKAIKAHEKYDMPIEEAFKDIKDTAWEVNLEDIP